MLPRWVLWVAGVAFIGLILTNQGLRDYWRKRKHLHKLEKKLSELQAQNSNLALELERIKNDPKIMGEYARKELGMIHPGEIEYRFVVENSTPKKLK